MGHLKRVRLGHSCGITVVMGVLVALGLVTVFPYLFNILASFKPNSEIFSLPVSVFPKKWQLANYPDLFALYPYARWLANSIIIATGSTVISLLVCSLAAFALAKYKFRGNGPVFSIVLTTMAFPIAMLLIPLFLQLARLKLLNTYWALLLPFAASPFGVFLIRQYIVAVDDALLDAARIDGCSEFGIYWRIILPVIRPALGVWAIIAFTNSWNDYLWPSVAMSDMNMFTVPVGLAGLGGGMGAQTMTNTPYGSIMAGATIAILPVLLLFIIAQRQFITGLKAGAVKG